MGIGIDMALELDTKKSYFERRLLGHTIKWSHQEKIANFIQESWKVIIDDGYGLNQRFRDKEFSIKFFNAIDEKVIEQVENVYRLSHELKMEIPAIKKRLFNRMAREEQKTQRGKT